MTASAPELASVCEEIARLAVGSPVQKVVQPDRFSVLLGLKGTWLYLSAHPDRGRLHFIAERPPGSGEAAPAFCMLLRKELIGLRLVAAEAVPGERACELRFAASHGEVEERRLRLFLFGRSAQLQLCDARGAPIQAIGPASRLYPDLPSARAESESAKGAISSEPSGTLENGRTLSAVLEERYRHAEEASALAEARSAALSAARAGQKHHRRRLEALSQDRARAESAVHKRKFGDLLLAHLHEIPKGARVVTLPDDFEEGAPIEIALDPALDGRQNAARLYKEHKRLTRALGTIGARYAETARALAEAEAMLAELAHATDEALERWLAAHPKTATPKPIRSKKQAHPKTLAYREFRAASGAPILVGRGADRNDELTFRVAHGGDLWLHARDVPGAHVVVALRPGAAIDQETLLDAATLAAYHSNAREEPQVDIGYTLRKHVRKPPRSRPGSVLTSNLKTVRVRIEPDRLARLLASRVE